MRYFQPFGITDVDAGYINGDPTIGRRGSIPPAESIEHPQREIVKVIERSALTPQESDLTQLLQAVRSQRLNYALATNTLGGTADVVAVAFDPPISNTMTPGMPLRIKAVQNNTGTTVLVVDGISNPLRKSDGSELEADDILAGSVFEAVWNESYWEFNNFLGASGPPASSNTYITKIPYAVDTGTANNLVAAFSPAITALVPGDAIEVRVANNVTGPSAITINALSAISIVRPNGAPLSAGDAAAGQIMFLIYSAEGNFQFFGIIPQAFSGIGVPVGSLIIAMGNAAPLGTLKLNGALLVRSEHPLLWTFANASGRIVNESEWQNGSARLWTAFSRGDGSTTFRLPDFRGEFPRWWDDARGVDPSRLLTTQQDQTVGNITMAGQVTLLNPKLSMDPPTVAEWAAADAYMGPFTYPDYERLHYVEDAELAWYNTKVMATVGNYGSPSPAPPVTFNEPYETGEGGPGGDAATSDAHLISWVSPKRNGYLPAAGHNYEVQWPGYSDFSYTFKHRGSRIVSDISITGSGGGNETRPRNAVVVPCIVDG